MAISVNRVIVQGNVGRDPEIRSFQSGDKVASFSVATSESWKDKKTQEWKEVTEWVNVSVTNQNLINYIEKVMKKGSTVYLEGKLRTRKWQDQNGNDKYTTEVLLAPYEGVLKIDNKKDSDGGRSGGAATRGGSEEKTSATKDGGSRMFDLDDDIPFAPEFR